MCDKCRQHFGLICTTFLGREFEQRDDPVEVVEAFTVQSIGSVYAKLAQPGIPEKDAKELHDKIIGVINAMNTRAMRDRLGHSDIPANALLN